MATARVSGPFSSLSLKSFGILGFLCVMGLGWLLLSNTHVESRLEGLDSAVLATCDNPILRQPQWAGSYFFQPIRWTADAYRVLRVETPSRSPNPMSVDMNQTEFIVSLCHRTTKTPKGTKPCGKAQPTAYFLAMWTSSGECLETYDRILSSSAGAGTLSSPLLSLTLGQSTNGPSTPSSVSWLQKLRGDRESSTFELQIVCNEPPTEKLYEAIGKGVLPVRYPALCNKNVGAGGALARRLTPLTIIASVGGCVGLGVLLSYVVLSLNAARGRGGSSRRALAE
jgi:hypothetical protein